jgi:hypothetical protein
MAATGIQMFVVPHRRSRAVRSRSVLATHLATDGHAAREQHAGDSGFEDLAPRAADVLKQSGGRLRCRATATQPAPRPCFSHTPDRRFRRQVGYLSVQG